jgi:lysophospholipase L1-like esterase
MIREITIPLIYIVGDSISMHYGPFLEFYTQGRFRIMRRKGDAVAMQNLDIAQGANCGDSRHVLEFLEARLKLGDFQPDLLLLNCGLHDIKRDLANGAIQVPEEEYAGNLQRIVDLFRSHSLPFAWMRTTHCVDEIHNVKHAPPDFRRYAADNERYNQLADRVMTAAGVPMIDLNGFTRRLGSDEELFCDHVHFQEPARKLQAAFIAGWLSSWEQKNH